MYSVLEVKVEIKLQCDNKIMLVLPKVSDGESKISDFIKSQVKSF